MSEDAAGTNEDTKKSLPTPPAEPIDLSNRAGRLSLYHAKLESLKEVGARRDIVERDLLGELATANLDRLVDFPLLDIERQSLLDILLRRSADHPAHGHFKNWLEGFIVAVNRHALATVNQDIENMPRLELEAGAAEAVIIKCLQALTFQAGLAKDDLSDAIIARHGEQAVLQIDHLSETVGLGEPYFKALIDNFAFAVVIKAYDELTGQKRTRLARDGQFLTVRFPFDEVLSHLSGTDKAIQKTRLQERFAATAESTTVRDGVAAWLGRAEHKSLTWIKGRPDIAHLAHIVAMDPIAAELVRVLSGTPANGSSGDDTVSEDAFVLDQAAASALGAAMGLDMFKSEFGRALRYFEQREAAAIVASLGVFAPPQIDAALGLLYEFQFLHILREKGESEAGKFAIRILRARRVTPETLAALAAVGFNRIRQRQLLDADPDSADTMLFKPRTLAELDAAIGVFHFEDRLTAMLRDAFENAPRKVEFAVILNLAKIAKVTTNLPAKVGEILSLFGVKP